MITDIEEYFTLGCGRCARFATADCSTRHWAGGLAALRQLCLAAGLTETVKWGHPCYMHAGRNIAIFGAFRDDFRLTFFNAALMRDPAGVMEKQGANTQHADMIRFTDAEQVARIAPVIASYLAEAMGYAAQGNKPPKVESVIDLPDTLTDALDADPDLAEAFHGLTPGRQKSYVIALSGAKTVATQVARVTRFRDRILAGKGANER
ncbi:YdeI/OmpD-associated family protein [Fertoebacter nigrum]|uniref:YdeI/OmpD-associated family protein n=1 Tax=Fertoeibacter niger TaxID=2656921 RepID=A0A8X8KJY2_9RHOB|nr:YdeI/OmpD-associated family protein [Fertoeibacter niger]NUB43684.1 YdeI/OmpD-associated family protein [Fertoeibacter niger]